MNTEERKTIFLVDDDVDYMFQMVAMLEKMGHNVVTANSQKEAEEMLDNLKVDLVISDLMMENKDSGFILSQRIKRKFPNMPVIIATAVTSETGMSFSVENDEDKKWIKADLCLEKGIRADQLHREINKLLKL